MTRDAEGGGYTDQTDWMDDALDFCVERGMRFPLIVCCISPNGSLLCQRVYETGGPDVLAKREEGPFSMPLTIVIVDAAGEYVHGSIRAAGEGLTLH